MRTLKVGILTSHPIQYQAPWFRELAKHCALKVYFAHMPNAAEQGAGFGRAFTWDVDLLSGYDHQLLNNVAKHVDTASFGGADTPEIADQIKAEAFDAFIVTGWHLKCFWQAIRACRRLGIPVLVRGDSQLATPRSKLKQMLKAVLYRLMLRQFSGFLSVGQRNRAYLRHYGVPDARIYFAPHFVDNAWFANAANAAADQRVPLRQQWGCAENQMALLFVGKFINEKDLPTLLAAIAQLTAEVQVKLVLVGSGPLANELDRLVRQQQLDVHFAGFKNQSELPACYAAADALVLPSNNETWGLVVNEAMACGLPVIVSDAAGCAPDLVDSSTGFTFASGQANDLARAITHCWQRYQQGHDWRQAVTNKLNSYSVLECTNGTMRALTELVMK